MTFENLEVGGTWQEGGRNLLLYLYPNEVGDRDEARNEVRNALKGACDQLLVANSMDYYEIHLYNSETDCNYVDGEDDGSTYFSNFKSWIDNNYGSRRGVHLGVTDHTNFANAESVGISQTAWVTNTKAFVGTAGGYAVTVEDTERYQNLAIQEPLHNMISSDYSYVSDMIEGDEHDLGKINSVGRSTPMLTFYERSDTHPTYSNDRSGKGDCKNKDATWNETHTQTVTSCTEDAVSYTAQYETS